MAGGRQKLVTDVEVDSTQAVRGLDKLGKSADEASVDVKDLAQELKKSDRQLKDTGDTAKREGDKLGDAFDNTKDSGIGAASAIGEAFGQGGSATDALGSMGEVVESVAESFGPLGGVVAVAGGAIIGMFAQAAQKAEELKKRTSEWFGALVEGTGVIEEALKLEKWKEFVDTNEDLARAVKKLLGVDGLKDLKNAVGGDETAMDRMTAAVGRNIRILEGERGALLAARIEHGALTAAQAERLRQIDDSLGQLGQLNGLLKDEASVVRNAASKWDLYATAVGGAAEQMARAKRAGIGSAGTVGGTQQYYDYHNPNQAAGGPVTAGRAYTVGEYGKETFVPAVSGTIIPNGGGTAGSVIINQTIVTDDPMKVAARTAAALRRQQWRNS